MKNRFQDNLLSWSFFFLYVTLLGIGTIHHELWMDESHHWLVARESKSIVDLFSNYKYDGHPILWVFCLWIIGKFTTQVIFFQFFNLLISAAIAFIFLFKSPFKKIYNVLFIFGYYPLFEYGIISRNYGLAILFLLQFCLSYRAKGNLIIPFILLGLVSNSHLFGFVFSAIIAVKILFDERLDFKKNLLPTIILSSMMLFAFLTIKAPSDHFLYFDLAKLSSINNVGSAIAIWWKAIIPIPDLLSNNFWNTNFFTANLKKTSIPFILISWFLPLLALKRKSRYWIVFYGFAIAMFTFCVLTGLHVSQRIGGFLLYGLIVIIWVERKTVPNENTLIKINFKMRTALLMIFFIVQIVCAGIFLITDINRPFSNTKNIYNYIDQTFHQSIPIYGGLYCNYLGIRNYGTLKLHIASQKDDVEYCDWSTLNLNQSKNFLEQGINIMNSNAYERIIFLSSKQIIVEDEFQYQIELVKKMENALVKNENAFIYLVSKK